LKSPDRLAYYVSAAGDLGLAMVPLAIIALPTVAISLWFGDWAVAAGLAVPGLLGVGGLLGFRYVKQSMRRRTTGGKRIVALAWLVAAFACAAPFITAASLDAEATETTRTYAAPVAALFESMSGLTSTGLTMTPDARELPMSLQFWRSILQWLGGVGILYLVVTVVGQVRPPSHREQDEADSEVGEPSNDREPTGRTLAKTWLVYGILTLACIAGLWANGAPLWDAINLGQTTIATGGFALEPDSLASYPYAVQVVAMIGTILGALSFFVLRPLVLEGDWRAPWRDRQVFWLVGLLLTLTAAVAMIGELSMWDAAFQVVSATGTCGFATASVGGLPLTMLLLVAAMFIGGSAGSTAGGLKIGRLRRLLRLAIGRKTEHAMPDEPTIALLRISVAFVVTLPLGVITLGLTVPTASWIELLFETTSALCTVGLTSGLTGPDLPAAAKLVLVVLMWLGRLEIIIAISLIVRRLGASDG
jgi:trk system potassium uptake protein TrkH